MKGRPNLIGIMTLVAILSGILLYFTNDKQNNQVYASYCTNFGFYVQSLALMEDGTFRFRYHGCSQSNGHIRGNWKLTHDTIEITPEIQDILLDSKYFIKGDSLISASLQIDNLIVCDSYVKPDQVMLE